MEYIRINGQIVKMTDEEAEAYFESQKTLEQKTQEKINELKSKLAETDYQSLKANEGVPSDDWETIKAEREAIREAIRELEA